MGRLTRSIEDRPWLHNTIVVMAILGLMAFLVLVSGCAEAPPKAAPKLDESGYRACDQFAEWQADGADPTTRPEVARKIHAQASNSNSGEIDDKAEVLFRMSNTKRAETWTLVADSFAAECLRLGWTAADAG